MNACAQDLACDSGKPCEPNILGFASPLWREYWLVTGTGQYLPNFSIFLSSKCEPVWGRHGGDLTHTWERIPGAEKGVIYFVSGKLQACPNYALHLHPFDCKVVATQWTGNDISKSWIELSNGASSPEYWILTPSNAPCPSKMLTAEAGSLRGIDFFRSPLTQWKIPGRDASPWPHRSSFLLLPQGSGCNASAAIEKQGLSNPSQCCDRAREQELQLRVSFGSFGTGSGRYDLCWGRTFGDGLNGGADSPLPASNFPIFVGVLSLLAPESLGSVQCTLGLPCFVTLSGLGLSTLDSLVVHAGSGCAWPELPPFDMEGAPNCSTTGSDSYLKAELVANQRLIVATACPRGGYEALGTAMPKALLRTYSVPSMAQLMEYSFLPLPNGIVGVALDGLAISGAPANKALWEQSQCGVIVTKQAMAEYALTPGGQWSDGQPCEVVKSWAVDSSLAFNSSHEPLLGFMMDGVPLFAPLSNTSNFSLDNCGGHSHDLPFYHYHAAGSFEDYSGKLLGCLRAATSGGKGFAVPAARISWPPVVPESFIQLDSLMATFQYGKEEVLLTNARSAARFLPQTVENSSRALYSIQRPAEVFNYSICYGRGITFDEHQVYLGSLIYIGPFQKNYSCVLARECMLQIEGTGLQMLENSLFVNRSCEDATPATADMPANPASGWSNSTLYKLGVITKASVGPSFHKICWSDSLGSVVEVGTLDFLGPARFDQNFACSLGRTCNVNVEEYSQGAFPLSILHAGTSCTEAVLEGGLVSTGTLSETMQPSWAKQYSFGIIPGDTRPGHLMLCWHPMQVIEGVRLVSMGIQIGTLTVRGPTDLQVEPPAVAGMFFHLHVQGFNLLDSDDIRIVENLTECGGEGAANNSQYVSFGERELVLDVMERVTDTEPNSSADDSDQSIPNTRSLSPDPDNASDTSDGSVPDASDTSDGSVPETLEKALVVPVSVALWGNVTIQVGGFFKVCWCAGDQGHSCSQDADFAVNAGSVVVRGPLPLSVTVMAGQAFVLQVIGVMLRRFDRMHLVPAGLGGRCFKASERPYQDESGVQLTQPNVSEDGTEAEWENATVTTAGQYAACWCPGASDGTICAGDFTYIGEVTVLP